MRRFQRFLPAAALVAIVTACQGSGAPPDDGGLPQSVAVQVEPPTATTAARGVVAFAAAVTGTANTSVVWTVVEQGGGTVDASGLYTAPGTTGTFHVRATSAVDPLARSESTVTVTALPPPITVAVTPSTASVIAGGSITFAATVTNAANTAVTWSVSGTSCGTITQAGVYTAPAAAASCSVVATSQADTTKRATATVTVTAPPPPITVAVTPSPAATNSCSSLTFTATVANTTNRAVTWSVQEGAAGGSITTAGVYTAPQSAGTYHVVATSVADGTKAAIATVTVTDKILSVAVSPQTTSVSTGGTARFTATVTTTCGSFASAATVSPTGVIAVQ